MKYTQNEKINQVTEETIVVGIDIGSQEHYARAFDYRGREIGKLIKFSNRICEYESFLEWIKELSSQTEKTKVLAGVEPTGHYWFALAEWLKAVSIELVTVNPYHVKRSKEFDDNSPSKTDIKDPKVIAKLLIDGRYNMFYQPTGVYADLRSLVNSKEQITKEVGQIKNKLHRWLSIYFPEYMEVYKSSCAASGLLVLKKASFPEEIAKLGEEGINKVFREAKLRAVGKKKAASLYAAAKASIGIKEGKYGAKLELELILENYDQKQTQLCKIMNKIEELLGLVPEAEKMMSIPGIGIATVAGFLSEVGDVRRFSSPRQIQKLAGLSLKENSSGKHQGQTTISKRGRSRLRKLLFQATLPLVKSNCQFKELHQYYTTRENNPLKKKQSLIALSSKLIRVFYGIIQTNTSYDGTRLLGDIKRPEVLKKIA